MATNQAAFNAVVVAVQNNQATLSPYLSGGTLNLNSQAITAADYLLLASALRNNTSVQVLSLSGNSIYDSGATALASMLQVNAALQFLHLQYNSIGDSGATALASMLQVNTQLQTLDLANNSIGVSGATALASALQVNTQLQTLDLLYNPITTIGVNALTAALACNYVMQTLSPGSNTQITTYLNRNALCAATTAQCPVLLVSPLPLMSGATVVVTPATLQISNVARTQLLNGDFIVSDMINGNFVNATQQVIFEFSQTAVNASQVFITADNSGLPITGNIIATFGSFSTCEIPLTFNVTNAPSTTTVTTTPTTTSMTPVVTTTTTSASITFTTSTATTTTLTSTAPSTITLQSSTSAPQTQMFAPNATVTIATTPTTTVTVTTPTATTLTMATSTSTLITTTITTSASSSTAIPSSIPLNASMPSTTSTQIFPLNVTNSSFASTLPPTALTLGVTPNTTLVSSVQSPSSSGLPIAPMAAGIAGGVVALGAAAAWWRHRRRKQVQRQLPTVHPAHPMFMHTNPLNPPIAETQFGWEPEYDTEASPWPASYTTQNGGSGAYAVPLAHPAQSAYGAPRRQLDTPTSATDVDSPWSSATYYTQHRAGLPVDGDYFDPAAIPPSPHRYEYQEALATPSAPPYAEPFDANHHRYVEPRPLPPGSPYAYASSTPIRIPHRYEEAAPFPPGTYAAALRPPAQSTPSQRASYEYEEALKQQQWQKMYGKK